MPWWVNSIDQLERQMNEQRGNQKGTDHTDVYKVLRFSLILLYFVCSFLSHSLFFFTKTDVVMQSSQSIITMMCKSIINYKYSIASLQSATGRGADNLKKQKQLFFVYVCVCPSEACVFCACIRPKKHPWLDFVPKNMTS